MGMLNIRTWGSFDPKKDQTFQAQHSGHAVAVDDAIKFLKDVVLPDAVALDKKIRAEGDAPNDGFAEADKRKLLA